MLKNPVAFAVPRWIGRHQRTLVALMLAVATEGLAQSAGSVRGTVTRRDSQTPITGVVVHMRGTSRGISTGADGRYSIANVPAGTHTIVFRWIGYTPLERAVTVAPGNASTVDAVLEAISVRLSDVIVLAASKVPERIVKAPAAITVVPAYQLTANASTNQVPQVLRSVPGFDVVQSGMNDFNINARGFNGSLSRRVLVLQDGRDLSFAFLSAQEWWAFPGSLDEVGRIEVVRGPGSALYGANAFNGVVNITTPLSRDVAGTKVNFSAGELETFRADARHAGVIGDGLFAYRLTGGFNRSDTYTRSRTRRDSTDIVREYAPATDREVKKLRAEARPLEGQTTDPVTGEALGERDAVRTMFGTGRIDYHAPTGSVGTLEGGISQGENDVFVTTVGRVQIPRSMRPFARANWAAPNYHVMGYYSGRRTPDPQYSLSSGIPLLEYSGAYHLEGQFNRDLADSRARVIAGASARYQHVDTRGTLMAPEDDARTDHIFSGFGQWEHSFSTRVKAVAGARFDKGNLYAGQISPKAALVFTPSQGQSFRATVNRAFQSPSTSEQFARLPAGAPSASPATLEKGLEAYFAAVTAALGAAGAGAQVAALGLPLDLPFQFPAATPALALGNRDLEPQSVVGYELGYRGELPRSGYVTLDAYMNRKRNFVTALLPGVNPAYPKLFEANGLNVVKNLDNIAGLVNSLSLPAATKAALLASQPALKGGVNGLMNLATTLPDGSRALVLSFANAGEVEERGIEVAGGFQVTPALRMEATYTLFDFRIQRATLAGDRLVPNTPRNKGNLSLAYTGAAKFDFGASARFSQGYSWLSGVFEGYIPASQIVTANGGYQISTNLRAQAVVTNLFDQKHFEMYGGSVLGRRVIVGLTATR